MQAFIGKNVAGFFIAWRDWWARGLIRIGVTPNMLTVAGMLMTLAAGACFALLIRTGHIGWSLAAGGFLFGCFGCDMLDGAVARIGGKGSPFGAILDSTVDRLSDFAIWGGLAFGFAWVEPVNLTFVALSLLCGLWAFLISYTKARAENLIEDCSPGFWKRGERSAAVIIAALACNPGALVVQQAISPAWTAWRRVHAAWRGVNGKAIVFDPRINGSGWDRLQPWKYPRMSWPYDLTVLTNIAWLIVARVDPAEWDLLGRWLG
jgi:CDP-diacylglycerol--glycerol-3-phosphate 3-phosphatidyltransferase